MAFQVCPLAFKKYAGVLCGLFLQLGIMLGVIVEIPYSYIIGINWFNDNYSNNSYEYINITL